MFMRARLAPVAALSARQSAAAFAATPLRGLITHPGQPGTAEGAGHPPSYAESEPDIEMTPEKANYSTPIIAFAVGALSGGILITTAFCYESKKVMDNAGHNVKPMEPQHANKAASW
jgi:hypothetical protein